MGGGLLKRLARGPCALVVATPVGDPVPVELRPGVVAGASGVHRAHVLVVQALLEAVPYG